MAGRVSSRTAEIGRVSGSTTGTVIVTGPGSIWTNSGQLFVGASGTGTLTIRDGGLVDVTGGSTSTVIAESNISTGTLNIGAASGEDAAAAGLLRTNLVIFGQGTGTLVFNHTDETGNYEFAPGVFSNDGTPSTIQHDAGFTRLTGISSGTLGFNGTTNIRGGTLAIKGELGGNIDVMGGGTLGGSGIATGEVTFNDGSYYLVEMDSTMADQGLTIENGAKLDGTVLIGGNYAYFAGKDKVVILTTNTTNGSFFDGATIDSIFLTPELSYETRDSKDYVYVQVQQATDFAAVARTPNQKAVSGALDTLPSDGNPLFAAVVLLESEEAARDAYDQMSGEAHASLNGALIENGQKTVRTVNNRIHNTFEAANGDTTDPANGFWITGYGNWTTTDATFNTHEMDNDFYGVIAGVDRKVGDHARFGVLVGYNRTNTNVDALASQANADSYTIGLYGGAEQGKATLSLGALYTWHIIDSKRTITFLESEMLSADYDARSFQFFAEAGYKVAMDRAMLEPFAGVSYINLQTDDFSETGGDAALSSALQTTNTTFTTVGLRSSFELASNVRVRGMAGWRHAFGDVDPSSVFTIAGSSPFTILGAPIAQDAAMLETRIDFEASDTVTISAFYEGQYGDGATAHGFNGRLLAAF